VPARTLGRSNSAAANTYLSSSWAALVEAATAAAVSERYVNAHLAALRAAAAVLTVRTSPTEPREGSTGTIWAVLPAFAPQLGEWASFFAAAADRRAAIAAGLPVPVTARDADDLLRNAQAFHQIVRTCLGPSCCQHEPAELPVSLPHCA
jgi:hypothetical protein